MAAPPIIAAESRRDHRLFWQALGVFALSVACLWSAGDFLEERFLVRGLLLSSVLFYAVPATVFLLRNWRELDETPFHVPRLAGAFWTLVFAVCVTNIVKAVGVWLRLAFDLPLPMGVLLWPLLFALTFLAPLCGELLFRPVLQRAFSTCWRPATGVWATAGLYALSSGDLVRLPEMFVLGFCGGVVFLRTGNYWAAVLFQAAASLLGLLQWRYLASLGAFLHPVTAGACAGLALFAAWRMQPPWRRRSGALANLRWALFGNADSEGSAPLRAGWGPALGYWVMAGTLAAAVAVAAARQWARMRPPPPPPFVQQSDAWRLGTNGVISAASAIEFERWPERREALTFALPYTGARLLRVQIADQPARTRMVGAGTFELLWPENLPPPPGRLHVWWEVSLSALDDAEHGYRARLEAMLPVSAYALRLELQPGCGFEFEATPERRETEVFSIQSAGPKPKNNFGTCGLGLAPVPDKAAEAAR